MKKYVKPNFEIENLFATENVAANDFYLGEDKDIILSMPDADGLV